MNKRRLMLLAVAACMVAILAVGGTLAYFTAEDEAVNVFTAGNVKIDLTEPKWDTVGSVEAAEAYPTEALAKDPTVKNIGANPCFVRISVTGWDCLINAGLSKNQITYRTDYVDGKLGDNWVLHTDGYYYYNKVLPENTTTDALFDQIVMPADMVNGDAETGLTLNVVAQAVQAQGAKTTWAAVQTMTVPEIASWFTTCGF